MVLVDIGPNLTHDSFDHDRDAVLDRARSAGVTHMIVTGSSLESTRAAIELVRAHPGALRATAGVHPHHAGEFSSDRRTELADLLASPEVIATGECGLDYFRNYSSHADQERVFRLQLELAVESRKPLFLHQREAHIPFVDIVKDYLPSVTGGVAHCFTEDFATARVYLEMGFYIGITGWLCDERRGQALRDTVRQLPLDRLLVETDAPYLLPRDLSSKPTSRRNEPAFLPQVVKAIAACRNDDPKIIGAATTENACRLFGWPAPS